jgi:hypothetical protein
VSYFKDVVLSYGPAECAPPKRKGHLRFRRSRLLQLAAPTVMFDDDKNASRELATARMYHDVNLEVQ